MKRCLAVPFLTNLACWLVQGSWGGGAILEGFPSKKGGVTSNRNLNIRNVDKLIRWVDH